MSEKNLEKIKLLYDGLNEMIDDSRREGYLRAISEEDSLDPRARKTDVARVEMRRLQQEELDLMMSIKKDAIFSPACPIISKWLIVLVVALLSIIVIIVRVYWLLPILWFFAAVYWFTWRHHFIHLSSLICDHAFSYGYYQGMEYLVDYRKISAMALDELKPLEIFQYQAKT